MSAIDQSNKRSFTLVKFTYGDPGGPTISRFVNVAANVTGTDGEFLAKLDMGVRIDTFTGVFDEKPIQIRLDKSSDPFFDDISNGEPHSPIFVEIWELIESVDGADVEIKLFSGRVTKVFDNFQGKQNQIKIEARTWKGKIDIPMGVIATHQCPWIFTGEGCEVVAATFAGTVLSISGFTVTLTVAPGTPAPFLEREFHRGYMKRDGLRITIRDWQSGDVFEMTKPPPQEWIGEAVTLVAGCDKTIETCRTIHNNEDRFNGMGFAMLPYNPNYETA